jgi:hypothetical protein
VRTVFDEKGNVIGGLYGKIDGSMECFPKNVDTAFVTFAYYLNPDGTRNLEFDPKRNLNKKLPNGQGVSKP